MVVRELITRLGFDGDHRQAEKYDKAIAGLKRTAMLATAAVTAMGGAIAGLTRSTAAYGDNVAKTSERLGIATDTLQEYRYAAKLSGIQSATLDMALQRMGRRVGEAANGMGEAKDALASMGIALRDANGRVRDTSDLLPEVAEHLAGMESANERNALAMKLFDSEGVAMVQMLKDGSAGLEEMTAAARESGFVMDAEAIRASVEYTDAMAELSGMAQGLRNTLGADLLPSVIEVIDSFKEWYQANQEIIRQNIAGVIDGISTVLRYFWFGLTRVGGAINKAVDWFGGWKNVIELASYALGVLVAIRIIKWLAALRWGLTLLSRVPVVAMFIVLGLLVQDLITYLRGGNSVIGEAIDWWESFREKASGVLTDVLEKMSPFIETLRDTADIIAGLFTLDGDRIIAGFQSIGKRIINWGIKLGKDLRDKIAGIVPEWMRDMFSAPEVSAQTREAVARGLEQSAAIDPSVGGVSSGIDPNAYAERVTASAGQRSGPVSITNSNQVNITANGDLSDPAVAESLSEQIGAEIDRRTRQSANQFPDAE